MWAAKASVNCSAALSFFSDGNGGIGGADAWMADLASSRAARVSLKRKQRGKERGRWEQGAGSGW